MCDRPKNSYPFGRLELAITWFISRFNSLMSGLLEGLQHKSLSSQRSAAQMTNITGELKSSNNGFNKMESQPLLGQSLKKQQEYLNQHTREAFEELEECLGALSAVEDHSQRYGSLFFDFQYLTGASYSVICIVQVMGPHLELFQHRLVKFVHIPNIWLLQILKTGLWICR